MKTVNSYSRKISKKEADNGFIFILKSKLSYFPKSSFTLSDGDITEVREIKSYSCTCRGPDKPHNHYYISWDNLEVGNIIEIRKNDSGDYSITQI
ncbi:MAG: hypothetical protein NKF70_06115 [Methanobacterium sp. ERen5]|nr:MAG: hypothetical protein NKF70_06115 [Methanobacterium sp. ERen5]